MLRLLSPTHNSQACSLLMHLYLSLHAIAFLPQYLVEAAASGFAPQPSAAADAVQQLCHGGETGSASHTSAAAAAASVLCQVRGGDAATGMRKILSRQRRGQREEGGSSAVAVDVLGKGGENATSFGDVLTSVGEEVQEEGQRQGNAALSMEHHPHHLPSDAQINVEDLLHQQAYPFVASCSEMEAAETDSQDFPSRHSVAEGNEIDEDEPDSVEEDPTSQRRPQTPLVYRYFGKNQASRNHHRSSSRESVPFVLLGPSVDHFKQIGKSLASRGFNVMACERGVKREEEEDDGAPGVGGGGRVPAEEGPDLVLAVLDALRWNRAVLVGCDADAALALEAAIRLAPKDRVAGLVLCGDLSEAEELVERLETSSSEGTDRRGRGGKPTSLDSYLMNNVTCPSTVIWDGNVPTRGGAKASVGSLDEAPGGRHRSLIVGGGSSPHRRLPEQFAWVLTRFVEKEVSRSREGKTELEAAHSEHKQLQTSSSLSQQAREVPHGKLRLVLPFGLMETFREAVSPGMLLVTGRVLATAIFYVCAANVAIYQYQNVQMGVVGLKVGYENLVRTSMVAVSSLGHRILSRTRGIIRSDVVGPSDSEVEEDEKEKEEAGIEKEEEGMETEGAEASHSEGKGVPRWRVLLTDQLVT